MNKVILIGNLGQDPEVKKLESGVHVATFSIATSETYKDKAGEKQTLTEWHNLVLWRGIAEVAGKYLKKGDKIAIEGKNTTRTWEDDQGVKKYRSEVVVRDLHMLGSKKDNTGGAPSPSEPAGFDKSEDKEDNKPF